MKLALAAIGAADDISIGVVYRRTRATGSAYHRERAGLYTAIIRHLDRRLTEEKGLGMVFMDGDDGDTVYRDAHRQLKLESRQ